MKRYDSYKDSGVEWIGKVPSDWQVYRLKKCLQERKEKNDPIKTDFILSLTNTKGVIPYSEKGDLGNKAKGDPSGYNLAYPGDIVLNSMNVVIGSVGLSNYFGAVSPVYYMLYPRSEKDDVRYYNYIFQMSEFQYALKGLGNGILEIRMRIPMNKLNNVLIPLPSSEEQQMISNYLDKKTSQIDSLIDKNEKSIELLEEYRKSIISEAVTKGLDPNAPMKDSGVEWIGEIPEGWVTRRLKNFLDNVPHSIVDGPFGSDLKSDEYTDTGVPVTQLNNIKEGFHRVDSFKFVSESKAAQLSSHFVFPGDLLMAKMMPAGRTCIASSAYPKYLLSSDSIRIVIDSSVDRRFVCYAANCYCLAECELKSSGVTRIRINLSIVRNLSFVLPSLQEQKKIADYLDQKTAEIDSLIDKKKQLIEKLTQYRKSLISKCVTGKIKVPGVE